MKHAIRTTLSIVALASLAMTASAQTSLRSAKPSLKPTLNALSSNYRPMIGTWTLRDASNKPLNHIRMVFRPNGTFAFVGPGWQSTGSYRIQNHTLSLEWSSVDGEKVAPGKMKKDYSMSEDDTSFTIDKYTYYKRS